MLAETIKPWIHFTVSMPKRREILVYIYKTRKSMHKAINAFYADSINRRSWVTPSGWTAGCIGFHRNGIKHDDAALFFYRGNMGGGTVAHECYHAISRLYPNNKRRLEEFRAQAIDFLTKQFWTKYYRLTRQKQPK